MNLCESGPDTSIKLNLTVHALFKFLVLCYIFCQVKVYWDFLLLLVETTVSKYSFLY